MEKIKNLNLLITVTVVIILGIAFLYILKNPPGPKSLPQDSLSKSAPAVEAPLQIIDLKAGAGKEAKEGNRVKVNYLGTLSDGTKFDSSYDHGAPFEFTLGAGVVIPGWDKGLLDMKIGGKRKLIIPPSLAYGSSSQGPIPPNSTLIFEIELLDAQ